MPIEDARWGRHRGRQGKTIPIGRTKILIADHKDNYRLSGRILAGPLGQMRILEGPENPHQIFTLDGVESIYLGRNNVPASFRWKGLIKRYGFGRVLPIPLIITKT